MRYMEIGRRLAALAAMAAAMMAVLWVSPAGAHELVEFQKEPTLAANGPIPPGAKRPAPFASFEGAVPRFAASRRLLPPVDP